MRREREPRATRRQTTERSRHLGRVLVREDPVRAEVTVDLHEGILLRRAPPSPADAALAVDHDARGLDEPRTHERREREDRRGGIAAGVRDERALRVLRGGAEDLRQPVVRAREEAGLAVLEAVPLLDVDGVREPERAGEIDDDAALRQELGDERGGYLS